MCGDCGCLFVSWGSLRRWVEAEKLWDSDPGPPDGVSLEDDDWSITVSPYWPGSLVGPW